MKTIELIAIAVAMAACGGSEPSDELGSDTEALTIPSGYGFSTDDNLSQCFQSASRNCYFPATKHLALTLPVQLVGSCAGPLWNNAFTAARGAYNTNVAGAGFSSGSQVSGFDPVITTRCVTSIAGNSRIAVSAIGGVVCFAGGCQYSNLRLDFSGNGLVADCSANHFTAAQCTDYIAGFMQAGLNHISGESDYGKSFISTTPAYLRMKAYVP